MFSKHLLYLCIGLFLTLPAISSPILDGIISTDPAFNNTESEPENHELRTRALPSIRHFYDITGSQYEPLWEDMQSKGYQLISTSIYGPGSSPRFALVYKKGTGPSLRSVYNVRKTRWNEWVVDVRNKGYKLTAVSATGQGNDIKYTGLAEKSSIDDYFKCELNSTTMNDFHQDQRAKSRIMKTVRQYGSDNNRLYCALFHGSSTYEKYTFFKNMKLEEYIARRKAQLTKPYWYPGFISISEDKRYSAIFTNVYRGSTHSDSKMTRTELEAKIKDQRNNGLFLYSLQASGSGSDVTFTALWSSLEVQKRTWRAQTGVNSSSVPTKFKEDINRLTEAFMKRNSVRQGQFSIGKNGRVLLERAYTWSEPNRRTTRPNDRFYLASVSKPFAAAAAQSLYDSDKLNSTTEIVNVLDLPQSPADARFKKITVSHLIDHRAGFNRSKSVEGAHEMRKIALDISNGGRPASTSDTATWIARQKLYFTPGTAYEYSNDGYVLLGRVIERASKREYYEYLKRVILDPENLSVGFWVTDPTRHEDDRVVQEDWRVGLSCLYPRSSEEVAAVFGGGGRYFESSKSFSSLTASAGTLTRFASKHALTGSGGRSLACKSGSAPGARTMVCSTRDSVDWALVFSTSDFPLNSDGDDRWDDLIEKVKDLVRETDF